MKRYGQYCPIARSSELLGERWTFLIVRNLLVGCTSFTEIADGCPGISRSLLSQRLKQLEQYEVICRVPNANGRGSAYRLTEAGEELQTVVDALGVWGARWLEMMPDHFDPYAVMWAMSRLIDGDELPEQRVVLRFDLTDFERKFWLLVQQPQPEVCFTFPGYEEDLIFTTSKEWLAKWHMGWISLDEARRRGLIQVEGPMQLVRDLERWGGLSRYADVKKAAAVAG